MPEPSHGPAGEASAWMVRPEKGSALGIRVLLGWTDLTGRTGARLPLALIAAWYTALHGDVRRASRRYWEHVAGRWSPVLTYRQIWTFAATTLDRVFFLTGRTEGFEVSCNGIEHLIGLSRARRGAILLGAHHGSFDAARIVGHAQDFPIHILVHTANARRINAFLEAVAPGARSRVIEADPADPSYILAVEEVLSAGGLVAIMADRVGLNERFATVPFLGGRAAFPTGPYALAAALGVPVYLTFGLFVRPNRYRLYCEPFAERIEAPRRRRADALAGYAARFARRLEHYVRLAPDNWFNFHDVFAPPQEGGGA